jgi:hypothetical protein
MSSYVSAELRRQVRSDAGERCGYCLSSERLLGIAHEVEHLIPESAGGKTERDNLWLACRRCNSFKADRCFAKDPLTDQAVPLFDPRRQVWSDHCRWSLDGTRIIGLTPSGRATVEALQLNQPLIVMTRELWVRAGVHPPRRP